MNHKESATMAQVNAAEVLLTVLSSGQPMAAVLGTLSIITYSGETVKAFDPQKTLNNVSLLDTKDSEFKKELKSIIEDGFENMLAFKVKYEAIASRIMSLYARIEAGEFDNERDQDNGSTNRNSAGINPVS